jgi:hypothetical protein
VAVSKVPVTLAVVLMALMALVVSTVSVPLTELSAVEVELLSVVVVLFVKSVPFNVELVPVNVELVPVSVELVPDSVELVLSLESPHEQSLAVLFTLVLFTLVLFKLVLFKLVLLLEHKSQVLEVEFESATPLSVIFPVVVLEGIVELDTSGLLVELPVQEQDETSAEDPYGHVPTDPKGTTDELGLPYNPGVAPEG